MAGSTVSLPNLPVYVKEAFQLHTETNPHQSEVEVASYAWLDSYGIYTDDRRQKFIENKPGLMVALCFPNTDALRLRTTMDVALWYFSFQGMVDSGAFTGPEEMRSAVDAIMRAANDPNSPSSKFQLAAIIQSCIQRITKDASSSLVRRLVAGLNEFTNARFEEKFNLSTVPTPEECIDLRRATNATKFWNTMIQYAYGLDLPDQVVDSQPVSELAITGVNIFNMLSDICSLPRATQGAAPLNTVSSTMHHHKNLDLQGSIDFVDKMLRTQMEKYSEAKAKLPSFGTEMDAEVAQYFQGIERCTYGLVEWSYITPSRFGEQAESVKKTGIVHLDMVAPA